MALNIPDDAQDGDILDPSDYMDDGWCYTVDCVDRMNYVSWTTDKEAWEARLLEGNFCHVGSHNNTHVANTNMSMGTNINEPPTCGEIYDAADTNVWPDYDYGEDKYWYHGSSLATATRLGKIVNQTLAGCDAVVIGNGSYADNPCGQYNITNPNPYWTNSNWRGVASITGLNMEYHAQDAWECPPNSHYENGTCIPDEGWKFCFEGSYELCPLVPGIPDGPDPIPPYLPPSIPPENPDDPVCPDCYTLDVESNLCVYTGGEGCEPVECITTAKCDATPITGVCEGRDDCI